MIRIAALALALLLPFGAHAAGILRFALDFDPDSLDPAVSNSYIERAVATAMCDTLVGLDKTLTLVPELATAWEWSPDHLALTLHLREGVQFQDGAPFDAEAVRANLERYRTAPYSNRRTELKPVVGEDVVDAHTLRIRLSQPYAPLLALMANRPGEMLSPRILEQPTNAISAHPVCAGPVRIRGAGGAGPHHAATLRRLLERRRRLARPDRVPDHDRLERAPGQPAVGRGRGGGTGLRRPTCPACRRTRRCGW